MEKTKKFYIKAMSNYNKGNIDRAIDLCEKSISIDLKNTASINLKGLLYYIQGDLDQAQKLWKMNFQVNKDGVAEKYLKDSKNDEERLKLYVKAITLMNELKIREAMELLLLCNKSDFNSINVNNCLCFCYIKTGEYEKAEQSIQAVLKLDRKNSNAKENLKLLQNLGMVKKKFISKTIIIAFSIILITSIFTASIYIWTQQSLGSKFYSLFKNDIKKEVKVSTPKNKEIEVKKEERPKEEKAVQQFPQNKAKEVLDNKNYDEIYSILQQYKGKNLDLNDKTIYTKLEDIMSKDGVVFFYKKATSFNAAKDYNNSINELKKAYTYSSSSYLNPHIIYMLATSFEEKGDVENAIKLYGEYDSKYADGNYEEIVLYNMALIYNSIDVGKAKVYAQKLKDTFPQSIYNNSNIKQIIEK